MSQGKEGGGFIFEAAVLDHCFQELPCGFVSGEELEPSDTRDLKELGVVFEARVRAGGIG